MKPVLTGAVPNAQPWAPYHWITPDGTGFSAGELHCLGFSRAIARDKIRATMEADMAIRKMMRK